MGRGLALSALLGALALLASCTNEDDAPTTATGASSSITATPTSATPTATPAPSLDQYGCDPGPDGEKCRLLAAHTPVPTPTLGPPPAYHPRGTRTGVPEVDALIDAMERRDSRRLAELVTFLTYPCEGGRPIQPHPLRCREGQEPGDPLYGIWAVHVEGGLWPYEADGDRSRLVPLFDQVLQDRPLELHSAFALQGDEPGMAYLGRTTSSHSPGGTRRPGSGMTASRSEMAVSSPSSSRTRCSRPVSGDDPAHPGWLLPRAR